MRISWKPMNLSKIAEGMAPPLGLMRISWKQFLGRDASQTVEDPPAWVNAD